MSVRVPEEESLGAVFALECTFSLKKDMSWDRKKYRD